MPKHKPKPVTERNGPNVLPELLTLPLELVDEPPLPARETMDGAALSELKESMSVLGLMSPIVTVKRGKRYVTVAGHRRLLAARGLAWPEIRAFVYPEGWRFQVAAMLHENIIREELNAAQEAVFFAQLLEVHKLNEETLCAAVKRSPDYVGDRLRLLRGDEKIFAKLRDGTIALSVARILNRFTDPLMRNYYLDAAVRSGTSARVVEQWFHDWQASTLPGANLQPAPAAPGPEAPVIPNAVACFLCGGDKDPFNLLTVYIHKWELAEIRKNLDGPKPED
jgi:ParB/RepB/Spo0J family partition protein